MKKRMIAILMAMGMTLAGCGNAEPVETPPSLADPTVVEEKLPYVAGENVRDLGEGVKHLAAPEASYTEEELTALSELYVKLLAESMEKQDGKSNELLSPTSLIMALGMCENGACGDTLTQMEEVLGGIEVSKLNAILNGMSGRLEAAKDVNWDVANSIWFKDDGLKELKEEFAEKAVSWYNAELWMAPFDDSTLNDINGWVNNRTRGMIPSIVDSIPGNARAYLINALAFEGEWMEQYEENRCVEDRDFHNADGSTGKVTLLNSDENRYFKIAGATGFLKDYKGGEYSFMGLLPDEETDMTAFVKKLSGEDLAAAVRNASFEDVVVNMPEFSAESKYEMSAVFQNMGMNIPFDEHMADFTDMVEVSDPSEGVFIGRILHRTHIEVDRKGTKAAAASAVEMLDKAAVAPMEEEPIYIRLDRPFVYGIIDNETGLPVFLGVVNQL